MTLRVVDEGNVAAVLIAVDVFKPWGERNTTLQEERACDLASPVPSRTEE
jgi:hypothetical protein